MVINSLVSREAHRRNQESTKQSSYKSAEIYKNEKRKKENQDKILNRTKIYFKKKRGEKRFLLKSSVVEFHVGAMTFLS